MTPGDFDPAEAPDCRGTMRQPRPGAQAIWRCASHGVPVVFCRRSGTMPPRAELHSPPPHHHCPSQTLPALISLSIAESCRAPLVRISLETVSDRPYTAGASLRSDHLVVVDPNAPSRGCCALAWLPRWTVAVHPTCRSHEQPNTISGAGRSIRMERTPMETRVNLPLSRRAFLTRAAIGLAATLGTGVLAACSQPPAPAKPAESKPAESTAAKPAAAAPTQAPIPVTAVVQPTAAPAAAPTQAAPAAANPAAGATLTVSQSV